MPGCGKGRRVLLADGTTTSLPGTDANQAAYPQPASQREGLGFPVMRLVVLLCLASGALLDAAEGACQGKGSGEHHAHPTRPRRLGMSFVRHLPPLPRLSAQSIMTIAIRTVVEVEVP